MRQHASDRLAKALTDNCELNLESPRAESGGSRWEYDIHQSSNSKSAYLSKLANAVSQIKRVSDLAQLGLPASTWIPHAPAAATSTGQVLAGQTHLPHQPSTSPPLQHGEGSLSAATPSPQNGSVRFIVSSPLQPISVSKLRQLMQKLEDSSGTRTVVIELCVFCLSVCVCPLFIRWLCYAPCSGIHSFFQAHIGSFFSQSWS